MKREEKNQLTRRRILDSAFAEFAEQGYSGSSINTIIQREGLSKGIVYHYFETKDDLYLACVGECFVTLAHWLYAHMNPQTTSVETGLQLYFQARLNFFLEHPDYQRIFCEAVIAPPQHLAEAIGLLKEPFDTLNVSILENLLGTVALRVDISRQEVIEMFRQYQDFINAGYQLSSQKTVSIHEHEQACYRALNILLYGVISRTGDHLL